jgi:sulfide:quinone oxidoreductase
MTVDRMINTLIPHLEMQKMAIHQLTEKLSVTDQITPEQVAQIAQAGFQSIVCNRPDGEAADQTSFDQIQAAAKAAGLSVGFLPVVPNAISDEHVQSFDRLMSELPQPVLAYCRTGTRSTVLWALSQAASRSIPEILRTAGAAGYDLNGLIPRLEALQK